MKSSNLLVAALIGVLISLSALSFHYFINERSVAIDEQYMAIYPAKSTYVSYDESIMYWPKVTSILMGESLSSIDPYLIEYAKLQTHVPSGSEFIVAFLVDLIDGSTNFNAIFIDIFSISILFLLLYSFLYLLSKSQISSALLALLFIFSFDLALAISSLPSISVLLNFFTAGNVSLLTRTTNMSISILPLVVFSYFFYKENISNQKSKISLNAMFVSAAFLVYFNFYMWTFAGAMIFFTYFVSLLYGVKVFDRRYIKKIIISCALYLLILIPFFITFYISYTQEGYQDYLGRFGVAQTRSIHVLSVGYLVFIFILHFLYKKYQNFLLPIIISFLITLLFVKNIQLLMGFTIQTFHWSRDAAIPFILILSIFCISQIHINKKFITLLLILVFSLFQLSAYTYSQANWRNHTANTEEVYLYNYLNKSTLDDDVIASPWVMSSSVLNYSKRKVYIPHAPITFANGKEIINRLIDYYCAVGVNSNEFKRILSDKHSYYSVFHMSNAYHPATFSYFFSRDNLNLRGPYFSDSEKYAMLDTLSECKKSVDNDSFMMQYRADYLIMPDYLKTTKFLLKFKFESINGFRIYNLNKKII